MFARTINTLKSNDLHNLRGQSVMPKPDAANPRQVDAIDNVEGLPLRHAKMLLGQENILKPKEEAQ
jgi:hypothetical protein